MHEIFKDKWILGEFSNKNSNYYDVTNIAAMGSCFARNFSRWLEFNSFTKREQPWDILYNPYSIYNEIFRIFEKFNLEENIVIEKDLEGKIIYRDPTRTWIKADSKNKLLKQSKEFDEIALKHLQESTLMLITLGLTEVWFNINRPNIFLNQVPLGALNINRNEWASKFLSVEEVEHILLNIINIVKSQLPKTKIIFTISPVPLKYTASELGIRQANNLSKSTLITSVNNLYMSKNINYFPSLELVQAISEKENIWHEDGRHINASVIEKVCKYFLENYTENKKYNSKPGFYVPYVSKEGTIVGKQFTSGKVIHELPSIQE